MLVVYQHFVMMAEMMAKMKQTAVLDAIQNSIAIHQAQWHGNPSSEACPQSMLVK